MKKSPSRRNFLATTALATTATTFSPRLAAGETASGKGPSLKARIFKAVKGGKKGNETPLQFFERLKALGFDGVSSS